MKGYNDEPGSPDPVTLTRFVDLIIYSWERPLNMNVLRGSNDIEGH